MSLAIPLVGIMQALALAGGRPVLVCAADLPFVTPRAGRRLAGADPGRAPAVAGRLGGRRPAAVRLLPAGGAAGCSQRGLGARSATARGIAAIEPATLEVADPDLLFNVNTPDDLLQAAAMLR